MPRSARKKRNNGDPKVGYGKPPVQHRFKPGTSGNPRGRPKALPTFAELMERELKRSKRFVIEGKDVRLTGFEVLARKLLAGAANGKAKPLAVVMEMMTKITKAQRTQRIIDRGVTVHEGMSAKEACDEYARWMKELYGDEDYGA
jgi:hypothetical protein